MTLITLISLTFTGCTPALLIPSLIQSTQKLKRISLAHSPFLRGPLQGFTVNGEGQGAVVWTQESTGNFTVQGRLIQNFKPQSSFSSTRPGQYSPVFAYEKGEPDALVGSFRSVSVENVALPDVNVQLMRLPLTKGNIMPEELGAYQLLNASTPPSGLPLLCQEFPFSGERHQTAAYVMLPAQGQEKPEFKRIMTVPNGAIFLAGHLDHEGDGLLLWSNEGQTYSQKITHFASEGEPLELNFIPTMEKKHFLMQMSAERGFIAFPTDTGLEIHLINDNQIEPQHKPLAFGVKTSYRDDQNQFLNVRSWDAQLSPEGLGWVAWVSENHQQAYYQRVEHFQFIGQPQSIPPNAEGMQFTMLRLSGDPQNESVIAGLDGRCSFSQAAKGCLIDLGQSQEVWFASLTP